ncbi:hypothetical protein ACIBSW_33815 [Actinoplanes sp. NPDC049668]|uniref:hypothetical protein n=1 Tax=unclassified Actinoplanes TaxID=2626549 RepID=UPI0033A3AC36
MRIFTKRSVKLAIGLPAAIAISAGVGLTATAADVAASPRAAAASSTSASASASADATRATGATGAAPNGEDKADISKRLKDSLLTAPDLPSGYSVALEPSPSDATSFDDVCAMWGDESDDASKSLRRLTAAKAADDDSAMVMFMNDSQIVLEHIAVIGEDKARAVVDQFVKAPKRCPVIKSGEGDDKARVTQSSLKVPSLGDASSGLQIVFETGEPPSAVQIKLVAVAWQDLSLVLMYLGTDVPDQHEVEKIAAKAAKKLQPNK